MIHFYDYLCETSLSKEGKNSTLGYLFEKSILKEVGHIKVLSKKFLSQKLSFGISLNISL